MCDQCDISYLLAHCAELADAGEFAAYAALFKHGMMVGHDGVARGPEEILRHRLEYFASFGKVRARTAHILSNIRITIEPDGAQATSRCYLTGYFLHKVGELLVPHNIGQYFDRFVKIDGRWWFKERRVGPVGVLAPPT